MRKSSFLVSARIRWVNPREESRENNGTREEKVEAATTSTATGSIYYLYLARAWKIESLKNIIQTTRLILTRLVSLGFFNATFLVFSFPSAFTFTSPFERWNKNSIWKLTFGCRFTFRVSCFVFPFFSLCQALSSSRALELKLKLDLHFFTEPLELELLSLYLELSIFEAGEQSAPFTAGGASRPHLEH